MTSQVIISWTETTITRCSVGRQSVRKYRWTVHRWNWADHWQTWAPTLTYQVSVCDPLPSSLAAPAATAPTSSTGCCSVTSPDDSSRSPATHATTCQSGFPQLRQNKIPQLFPITLKYFQAFRGAIYNSNLKCWLHAQGQYWAGRTPRPNNGTPSMAATLRLCPELVAILGGDLIRGYMIWFGVNRRYGIWMNIYTDLWLRTAQCFFCKTILSGTHILMTSSGGDQCKYRHAPIWHFG